MQMRRFILKGIAVFLAAALFMGISTPILKNKGSNAAKYEKALYSDDSDVNEADVIFLGGSHAYNGFDPDVLWSDYGIKSYNYSNSGQAFYLTYYLFREILKNHSPKVAVVDLYYIGMTSEYFSESMYLHNVVDSMTLSQNKLDFIFNCVPDNEILSWLFPFFYHHARATKLTASDFSLSSNSADDFWLGSGYQWESGNITFTALNKTEKVGTIPEKSAYYLNAIIDLAKENNVSLVFTSLPHDYTNAARPDDWVDDEYAMFNAVKQLAAENDIPFLQFVDGIMDEINFDTTTDMFNSGHMNVRGAEKVSDYIGQYLSGHFDLPDYSGQDNSLWDGYAESYRKAVSEQI